MCAHMHAHMFVRACACTCALCMHTHTCMLPLTILPVTLNTDISTTKWSCACTCALCMYAASYDTTSHAEYRYQYNQVVTNHSESCLPTRLHPSRSEPYALVPFCRKCSHDVRQLCLAWVACVPVKTLVETPLDPTSWLQYTESL